MQVVAADAAFSFIKKPARDAVIHPWRRIHELEGRFKLSTRSMLCTSTMNVDIGLAGSPGTAVDPMWWRAAKLAAEIRLMSGLAYNNTGQREL